MKMYTRVSVGVHALPCHSFCSLCLTATPFVVARLSLLCARCYIQYPAYFFHALHRGQNAPDRGLGRGFVSREPMQCKRKKEKERKRQTMQCSWALLSAQCVLTLLQYVCTYVTLHGLEAGLWILGLVAEAEAEAGEEESWAGSWKLSCL